MRRRRRSATWRTYGVIELAYGKLHDYEVIPDAEGGVREQWLDNGWTVILENGAEQAKFGAGKGRALGRRKKYYGFDQFGARATDAEERLLRGEGG